MNRIKVALVANELESLDNITNVIIQNNDMYVVWSAVGPPEALPLARSVSVDIILAEVSQAEKHSDGIGIIYEIAKISNAKIIILADSFNENLIQESFSAGAVNCLPKSELNRIPEVIRNIHHGNTVIEILARDYRRLKADEHKEKLLNMLSSAEKEVINLYIMGYKRKEIAASLGKTEDTIKNQVSSSYKKLNVGRRKELLEKLRPF